MLKNGLAVCATSRTANEKARIGDDAGLEIPCGRRLTGVGRNRSRAQPLSPEAPA